MDGIINFLQQTGFYIVQQNPLSLIMLVVSCVLLYLAIVKQFEPLLLLPIAFGMLLTNLPGAGMFHEVLFANGHVQWELFGGATVTQEIIDEIAAGGATENIINELYQPVGNLHFRGLAGRAVPGRQAGHLPLPDLLGRGRHDRLWSPDRQPQEPAAGRCRSAGHLRHLCGRSFPEVYWSRSFLYRHHRRRGRPHGHLHHQPSGSPPPWPHRCGGLLLHGAGAGDSASHHEAADHRQGAEDQDEAAAPRLQDREDPVPHHCHHLRVLPGAFRGFSGGLL